MDLEEWKFAVYSSVSFEQFDFQSRCCFLVTRFERRFPDVDCRV